jgi:Protein of unknown function, DUF573
MAAKRKSSAPPAPATPSSSSDHGSSSDEEHFVAQPNPSNTGTSKRDDPDSGSESDPEPPTKTVIAAQKPSKSEDSSEEDEEEQEKVKKVKSPAKDPPQTDKQKSDKSSGAAQRIWTLDDELALLRALLEYRGKNGKLPTSKDLKSFLSGISELISFPVTEKQIFNKIRQFRHIYNKKKEKGPKANFSQPHDVIVYKLCMHLFEDSSKSPQENTALHPGSDAVIKSKKKKQKKVSGSQRMENGGTTSGGAGTRGAVNVGVVSAGVENGGVASGHDMEGSHFYLNGLIKDMICTQQCPKWISKVEDVVAWIGESRAQDLEVKAKKLRIETFELCARKEKVMAELFDILANEMTDD